MKLAFLSVPILFAASLSACALSSMDESSWRDAIVDSPSDQPGCFHAAYPDMSWEQVSCTAAPNRPFAARPAPTVQFTVGNGADFALQDASIIQAASGSFIRATNVTSENDGGTADTYSIQLNSNFMPGTAACSGGGSACMSWAQFVYSTSETSAFIQNWLIGFGATCPTTTLAGQPWNSDGQGDCFINSAATTVAGIPITSLHGLKMGGHARAGGNDTLVFANGTDAFTTSEPDNTTNLSSAWNSAEFNIIGDGGGSEAVFNTGAKVKVKIGVRDGTTAAPTCLQNGGTTGETNNLNLGTCTPFAGTEPSIEFVQSD
jgi:hypothetical protein